MWDGMKWARNQMSWLLKKGQDLSSTGQTHALQYFSQKFGPQDHKCLLLTLYASDAASPSAHRLSRDVYKVAEVVINLDAVPSDKISILHSSSGREYHRLAFEVHITLQSTLGFSLVLDGTTFGSLTATYD
jgi:hypothetical protein